MPDQNSSENGDMDEMTKYLIKGVIDQHKENYSEFKKEQTLKSRSSQSRQTQLRKYLGMNSKL